MTRARAATAGLLLLAATALNGCGDDGDATAPADGGGDAVAEAPTDADPQTFCEALTTEPPGSDSEDVGELQDAITVYADRLAEVGTPADLAGEAREGFEVYVSFLGDLSDEDARVFADGDDDALFQLFDESDGALVESFYEAAGTLCTAGG